MLKAIKNGIIVLRDDNEKVTDSGIILPDEEMPTGTGIVMSVGNNVTIVEVGQRVIFGKLDGHDYKEDGKEYVALKDFNIQGVYA